jgi:hypothetical protein
VASRLALISVRVWLMQAPQFLMCDGRMTGERCLLVTDFVRILGNHDEQFKILEDASSDECSAVDSHSAGPMEAVWVPRVAARGGSY